MTGTSFRVWLSGREMISYQERDLRCEFFCTYPVENRTWTVFLEDFGVENGEKRKLSRDELARAEKRIRAFLAVRKFFGINIGRYNVDVIKAHKLHA